MQLFEPYKIEPYSDFSQPDTVAAYKAALERVRAQLGRDYPLVIGGEQVTTEHGFLASLNPCNTREVVGRSAKAKRKEVERAMDAAWKAYGSWSRLPTGAPRARADEARRGDAPPQVRARGLGDL